MEACGGGDAAEVSPDVSGVEGAAGAGCEDEVVVGPVSACRGPVSGLAVAVLAQGLDAAAREGEGASRGASLGVAPSADRPPDPDVGQHGRVCVSAAVQVDVAPGQGAQLLGAGANEQGQQYVGADG